MADRDPNLAIAPEIGGPDRIQPGGLPSDTFAAPARPVIDNNMERLAGALGHFNSSIQGWHSSLVAQDRRNEAERERKDKEAERLAKEAAFRRWNEYLASNDSPTVLADIRSGKLPYASDPYLKDAVPKEYGNRLAFKLADEIDADIKDGKVPLGDPSFNPERYLLEKSAGYVKEVSGSAGIVEFREKLDSIRRGVVEKHETARGQAYINFSEDTARRHISETLDAGVEAGLTGKTLSDEVRKVYAAVGPRIGGGSFDIANQRLDAILLDVAADKAKDPAKAKQVLSMLDAPRDGMDGNPIPPLSQVNRNADRVGTIRDTAVRTLQVHEKATLEQAALNSAAQAFARGDGSFNALRDEWLNGPETGVPVEIKADAVRKQAVSRVLSITRAQNGGQPDYPTELRTFMRNNVEHPEISAAIGNGFFGVGGTSLAGGKVGPEQVAAVKAGAAAFNAANGANPAYVGKYVPEKAQAFYDAYNVLREAGLSEEAAATQVTLAFSKADELAKTPGMTNALREVTSKVQSIDFNAWYQLGGTAVNSGELAHRVERMAKVIASVQGIPADKAVEVALDRVGKSAVMVNGVGIFGSNLQKDDVPAVQTIFNGIHKQYRNTLAAQGIDDPSDITFTPIGNGHTFYVRKAEGEVVMVPVHQDDDPAKPIIGEKPLAISYDAIAKLRQRGEEAEKADALQKLQAQQREQDETFRRQYGMTPWERDKDTLKTVVKKRGQQALDALSGLLPKSHVGEYDQTQPDFTDGATP